MLAVNRHLSGTVALQQDSAAAGVWNDAGQRVCMCGPANFPATTDPAFIAFLPTGNTVERGTRLRTVQEMVNFWNLPSARLCFALLAAMFGAAAIGISLASFAVKTDELHDPLTCLAGGLVMMGLSAFPVLRLKDDNTLAARILKAVFGRTLDLAAVLTFVPACGLAAGLLSYLAMSAGMPMQDALYASIDKALGFDWLAFLSFVNARAWIGDLFIWSYGHWAFQLPVVILLFVLQARQRELWDLLALLTIGAICSIVFCGLMPAVAAYTYYGPNGELYDVLARKVPAVGTGFLKDLLALHSGTFKVFDWTKVTGIVTFPSFHAIAAMTIAYALRNDRLLFVPAAVFNGVVVVSAVPVGGHYFVDLIGATVMVFLAVSCVAKVNGEAWPWSRLRSMMPALAAHI